MKKNLILLVALLLCRNFLFAQRLDEYVAPAGQYMYFSHPCTGIPTPPFNCGSMESMVKTEYPPWIIATNGTHIYHLTDGNGSGVASSPASMITSTEINFRDNGTGPIRATNESGSNPWSRDYYSIYSAQLAYHPTDGPVSLAFTEGENYSQNGSSPCAWMRDSAATTYLCLTISPHNLGGGLWPFADLGPIIWPASGYFYNGQKSSLGCANNTTIQADDGYLYVFYKDQSCDEIGAQIGPGRQGGIKVARAPINDAWNPHAYQTYYEDANGVHWNQSLPAGLTKSNIQSYIDGALGPQGTTILEESDRDYTRFAVAKVVGGNVPYYMGLGNYPDPDPAHRWQDADGEWYSPQIVTLKYSYDLLHWRGDRTIYTSPSFKTSNFNYSIFLRSDGWTNNIIDENEFYIVGTQPQNPSLDNFTYRKRIFIPPPTPQPQPGGPIPCNRYLYLTADPSMWTGASGARLGDLDVTGDKLTVEAVFNRTEDYSNAVDGGMLVSKDSYYNDANYILRPMSGAITTTDGYFQVNLPCPLEMNTTNHVAMVYDGAQLSIYRNGSLAASVPATGNLITNDYPTTIGTGANFSNWDPTMHFRGYIAEARIWKVARTQQDIQLYKDQTIANAWYHPDLLAYFSAGWYSVLPNGMDLLGNASYEQTNPNCALDPYGCFGLARKDNSTTKQAAKGTGASSVVIYPNPAGKSATLTYSSDAVGSVTINVIDVSGKRAMVMKKPVMRGSNTINIDLHTLSNGVYSVQLIDGNKALTKKLVIIK